jgi:acetyl esterase/lipase
MANDLSAIHPELRQLFKRFPRFTINRWNLRLIRRLAQFVPKPKISNDIQIDHLYVQNQNASHPLRLRVYKPKTMKPPAPVLVWIHGGGFIIGTVEMDDANVSQFAQELGILIVSVDYRLAPDHPFPIPLEDCHTALKWVHDHADMLGIDPNRIAIGGGSAGGGLAASLVQRAQDQGEVHPIFQLLVYPMLDDNSALISDLPHKELLTWTQESNRFGWESYLQQPCGLDQVPPYSVASRRDDLIGLPPAWIGVGTLDLFYEEDVAYAKKLKQCGVDCELEIIPGAFHGFDALDLGLAVVQDFRKSQMAALRKYLFPK